MFFKDPNYFVFFFFLKNNSYILIGKLNANRTSDLCVYGAPVLWVQLRNDW